METTKKLQRIEEGKVFTGVCNGMAEHFNMDVNTVRILYVVISLFWAIPVILYIIFSFTLPVKGIVTVKAEVLEDEYSYDPEDYKI